MKRLRTRNWILVGFCFTFLLAIRVTTSTPVDPHPFFASAVSPLVIAHRGGAALRPENTLPAFDHALTLGVDMLELDVRRSLDGAFVVMHDETVDRTTNGQGRVAALALAALQTLDAAYQWPGDDGAYPYRGRGVTVPQLTDVLERYPTQQMMLDVKPADATLAEPLCALLMRLDALERVLVVAASRRFMVAFRAVCPQVATGAHGLELAWFVGFQKLSLLQVYQGNAHLLPVPVSYGPFDFSQERFVASAAERGLVVFHWTVNDENTMRNLLAAGTNGLLTDRPDVALRLLGRTPSE